MIAFIVTPGFEPALSAEIADAVRAIAVAAPGVVVGQAAAPVGAPPLDPVFARQVLPDARVINGPSVNALAEAAYAALEGAVDAGAGPFTLHAFAVPHGDDDDDDEKAARESAQLGSRIALIGRETLALLQKRRRRAFVRYQAPEDFAASMTAGTTLLQIAAIDRHSALVSAATPEALPRGGFTLAPWPAGVAPVAVDRAPPSRAYQKLEEAFLWMNAAPGPGELCVDLGAAPGGWTMTALKRGARLIAVDRAPLSIREPWEGSRALPRRTPLGPSPSSVHAPPAAPHPRLTMTIGNAFTYAPPQPVDWLLCDVICEPQRSIDLLARWLRNRWCRAVVCTVKFKGREGYGVLAALPALLAETGFRFGRVKQLRRNKNEVTVMGVL